MKDKRFAKALGITLKTIRRLRGFKVITVHSELGFSETSVTSWELGRHMPTLDKLYALSKLYRVRISTIMENAEATMIKMEKGKTDDHP